MCFVESSQRIARCMNALTDSRYICFKYFFQIDSEFDKRKKDPKEKKKMRRFFSQKQNKIKSKKENLVEGKLIYKKMLSC